jgi:tetratricopeptide (TPR) repeat protein
VGGWAFSLRVIWRKGLEAFNEGNFEKAGKLFAKAINRNETNDPVFCWNLGLCQYSLSGLTDEAWGNMVTASEGGYPDAVGFCDAYTANAEGLEALNAADLDDAEAYFMEAIENAPFPVASFFWHLGLTQLNKGDHSDGKTTTTYAAELGSAEAQQWLEEQSSGGIDWEKGALAAATLAAEVAVTLFFG